MNQNQHISQYIFDLKQTLDMLPLDRIAQAIDILQEARLHGRQVFIMGNGGSASTASHFVCDLSKNTRQPGWPHFKVIGLADNMASFSAFANDEGYASVFAQQMSPFIQPDDIVIAISTSGNSPNVLEGVALANQVGAYTIGFTGFAGGKLSSMVDLDVHVPSHCIEHVEDIHLMLEHLMVSVLRQSATLTLKMDKVQPVAASDILG
ncbi:MAG: SIS domain-containing protein [Anaerolineae bacterium]|nr:SIS domain-containing protein [Anaerolineae bacterium]